MMSAGAGRYHNELSVGIVRDLSDYMKVVAIRA